MHKQNMRITGTKCVRDEKNCMDCCTSCAKLALLINFYKFVG